MEKQENEKKKKKPTLQNREILLSWFKILQQPDK